MAGLSKRKDCRGENLKKCLRKEYFIIFVYLLLSDICI